MNVPPVPSATARLLRRGRVRFRVLVVRAAPASPPRRPRRRARAVVAWFAAGVLALHLFTAVAMDAVWPQLRDPEYGRRAAALRERVGEHPGRPLVVVVGSSRAAMGVRPGAWEAARPGGAGDPLLFNMGAVGGGPVTELLMLRRVFADGFRPEVVLIEYWPPLLRQDGEFGEAGRIDPRRLRRGDRDMVRDYFPDPGETEREMRLSRLNVISGNRERLLAQAAQGWVHKPWRIDRAWLGLDGWGWLPGMDPAPEDAATRRKLTEHQRPQYRKHFNGHAIHPDSDRALREAVALARSHGARVAFLYLPESPEFRSWYPPAVESAGREHLGSLSRELAVPVVDARDWMDECYLADGFHLSRVGAGVFTARLGPAVANVFFSAGGTP